MYEVRFFFLPEENQPPKGARTSEIYLRFTKKCRIQPIFRTKHLSQAAAKRSEQFNSIWQKTRAQFPALVLSSTKAMEHTKKSKMKIVRMYRYDLISIRTWTNICYMDRWFFFCSISLGHTGAINRCQIQDWFKVFLCVRYYNQPVEVLVLGCYLSKAFIGIPTHLGVHDSQKWQEYRYCTWKYFFQKDYDRLNTML